MVDDKTQAARTSESSPSTKFSGEWKTKRIEELAVVIMGQSPSSMFYNEYGEGLPLIQGNADIEHHHTIDRVWTTQASKRCNKGDLLLTVRAPVGYVAIASKDACLGRGVAGLKPIIDHSFLFHALVNAESRWQTLEQGSTFTAASAEQVKQFQICVPESDSEQRAIAAALSDVDGLLDSLDALIAKKRAVKEAAMQELLTGRTRLPGFGGEWETKRLGDLVACQQGGTPSKSRKEYWGGHIPFVTAADLTEFRISAINARAFLTIQGLNSGSTAICEPGSLLLATKTRVGEVSVADELMAASQDITVLSPSELVNLSYLYWALKNSAGRLKQDTRGTTIQGVTRENVDFLTILCPRLHEQRAIAIVLADMDAEIAALEQKKKKTEAVKRGMMQELLTGRVRLSWYDIQFSGVPES